MTKYIFVLLFSVVAWGNTQMTDAPDSLVMTDTLMRGKLRPAFPGNILARAVLPLFEKFDRTRQRLNETPEGRRFLDLVLPKDGNAGFAPDYSRRAGFGLNYTHKNLFFPGSHFFAGSRTGYRWRQKHTLFFRKIPAGTFFIDLHFDYLRYTFEFYFGRGPETSYAERREYCHEKGEFTLHLGRHFMPGGAVLLVTGSEHHYSGKGREHVSPPLGQLCFPKLEGYLQKLFFYKAGLALRVDTRKKLWFPRRGYRLYAGVDYYDGRNRVQDEYYEIYADLRSQTMLSHAGVLAFRTAGNFLKAVHQNRIPFYKLSQLGQTDTIRGVIRGRYRANHMVLASLEYRYWITRTLWGVLFVDTGQVTDRFPSGFQRRLFCVGYGAGFRFKITKFIFYRINLGFSRDGFPFYVHVGEK